MPRALPHVLALLLGVGAALLVACGGGGGTTGGIPAASAGELKSQLTDVRQAVEDKRCDDVSGQLRQVDTGIDELPSTVDERLRQGLRDASELLRRTAIGECDGGRETQTQTQTTPEPTQPQPPPPPVNTQTQPPTTTEPTDTQTDPQPTTPTPTTPQPDPDPEPPPDDPASPPPIEPPPPATPGGGARPDLDGDG